MGISELDVKARMLGNILSVVGYLTLVHINPLWGSIIKIVGLCLVTPFCIRIKLWDVVVLFGFFGAIDLSNVIKLIWAGG